MAAGKHVYVQKPMCWSVAEARHLAKMAADHPKLVTQMGNQGHSYDDARRGQDYLASGVIGDVKEVHVWTNRPLAYWPQGVPRPAKFDGDWKKLGWANAAINKRIADGFTKKVNSHVPKGLRWDLFLGAAPDVGNIVITGHADRIGSANYNQKLSEQRANAVKTYLVGKGVAASRLTAVGKGEANPVVVCKERKMAELIKCLEPNRRVEVEQITIERRVQ